MQDKIKIVREHKGKTVWMEIKASMWNSPETKNQKKVVESLKRKGWSEMEDGKKYEISIPGTVLEVEKKARKKKKS